MRRLTLTLVALAAVGSAAVLGGCNIVAPAIYMVHGPQKTKARYTLDEEQVAVVFIDDRENQVPRRALRIAIAEEAERLLLAKGVVKDMVAGQSALLAAGNDRGGRPAPIAEVGRAVEAATVIYVTVDEFTLSPDGQTYAPTVRMRAKVVDVASDAQLWPAEPTGHSVYVRPQVTSRDMPSSVAERYQAEDDLARLAGIYVANLFHDHERVRGARIPD